MRLKMKPPVYIQDLCQAFLNGLKAALGDKLYGVYLHGAVAFPETTNTGDIDFHVILAERLSEGEHSEIKQLHAKLADDFPPLGIGMDGYYLLLEDARGTAQPGSQLSPFSVDDAWALHRAHIRAGRCIVLHGPDPNQIYPSATWVELEADLEEQLQYVEAHLEVYPAYCILNLCRLMTSFETHDVVISKAAAAEWARDLFPQWQDLIDAALKVYAKEGSSQDEALMKAEVTNLYQFACEFIKEARRDSSANQDLK
jgi:hypothetical protein